MKNADKIAQEISVSTDPSLLDRELIYGFIVGSYWAKGIPRDTLDKAIKNSLCFGAYKNKGNTQVGFARVVTDYSTFAYLCDVFVVESERGQGVSRLLLSAIMAHEDLQGLRRFCLGTLDGQELYKKFGFVVIKSPENWMEIKKPNIYIENKY